MARLAGRPQPIARIAGLVVLVTAVAAGLWVVRWDSTPVHGGGDTFNYTRQALIDAGWSPGAAQTAAADFAARMTATRSDAFFDTFAETMHPRYAAIFTARPLFPATAAPLVPVVGVDAMIVSAFVAAVLLAVVLATFVWSRTGSLAAAVLAAALVFVLPVWRWIVYVYADGWMLAWWAACLALASTYLATGRRLWLAAFGGTTVLLWLTKSANADELATAFGMALAASLPLGRRVWQRMAPLTAISVGLSAVGYAIATVLHLPGVIDSLQDFFTHHFQQPDVSHPVRRIVAFDEDHLGAWAAGFVGDPPTWLPIVAAVLGLRARAAAWALPWLTALLVSPSLVLLHPVRTEVERLAAPAWLTVIVGLALGAA
jgi:hypothetical protein